MSENAILFLLELILMIGGPLAFLPAIIVYWCFHQNRKMIGLGCILCIVPLFLIFPFNLFFWAALLIWSFMDSPYRWVF